MPIYRVVTFKFLSTLIIRNFAPFKNICYNRALYDWCKFWHRAANSRVGIFGIFSKEKIRQQNVGITSIRMTFILYTW